MSEIFHTYHHPSKDLTRQIAIRFHNGYLTLHERETLEGTQNIKRGQDHFAVMH